jgi:hypothetical protein
VEALHAERQKIVDDLEKPSGASNKKLESPGPSQTQWGSGQEKHLETAGSSSKVKRRPNEPVSAPSLAAPSLAEFTIEPKEQEVPPPLPVKQQSYTVLTGMFTSNPDESTKLIDWDVFVTAMAHAGFAARHSSGSAVTFEPDDWKRGWAGKILFHKPHPVAKIDTVMLRSMGKRMEKRFG